MQDKDKTKAQLIQELNSLRRQVDALETVASGTRKQAEKALDRRAQEILALYEISLKINSQQNLSTLLNAIVGRATTLLNASSGVLLLLQPNGETLKVAASVNMPAGFIGIETKFEEGVAGRIVQTGQPLMITNYTQWEGRSESVTQPVGRVLGVPLKQGNQAIGALDIYDEQPGTFDEDEVKLLKLFAAQATTVINNIRLFEEARQSRKVAEDANKAKSVFVANMSHELRTPLNAILGFTQLMQRDATLSAKHQENLGIINRSGQHLLSLINNVLEMSKIEAGRITFEKNNVDLHYLLDTLEEKFRLKAYRKGLELIFNRQANVPRHIVTDENKLRQVLTNLINNAIKFTSQGTVTLTIKLPDTGFQNPSQLLFEISDTGPGIAKNKLNTLFDPFVQTTDRHSSQDGVGLGLAISRQFVELMGGTLTVKNKPDNGSVFKFHINAEIIDTDFLNSQNTAPYVIGLAPNQPVYRLLVAEDRLENRILLVRLLESVGFTAKEAVNGQEAIEIWHSWQPHLIFMDMRMPVLDGYEATKQIKAAANGQSTIIVALTTSVFNDTHQAVYAPGCDDFISKPFQESEVFEKIAQHLGVKYMYQTPASKDIIANKIPANTQLVDAVNTLPTNLIIELQNAIMLGEISRVSSIIEQIGTHNAPLGLMLAKWANNFEYDQIDALLNA